MGCEEAFIPLFLSDVPVFQYVDNLEQLRGRFVECSGDLEVVCKLLSKIILYDCRSNFRRPNDDISKTHIHLREMRYAAPNTDQQSYCHVREGQRNAPYHVSDGNFPLRTSGWPCNNDIMCSDATKRVLVVVSLL